MTNAFITAYITRPKMSRHPHTDWPVGFAILNRLAESVAPYGELIVCADQLTERHIPKHLRSAVTIHRVTQPIENVYFERWDLVRDVLKSRTDIDLCYAVDGRDVIAVRDPWDYIEPGTLYTCTEPARLPSLRRWRGQPLGVSGFINDVSFHESPVIQAWTRANRHRIALNAGVTAADRSTMLRFATRMAEARLAEHVSRDYTDMALYNWVAHSEFTVTADERFIGAKCHLAEDAPEARVLHVP